MSYAERTSYLITHTSQLITPLFEVFSHSFSVGMRQWRVAAIVYFFQICLALTLGMQVHSVLEASIGHSLEISKLLAHYDHTVLTDFLKVHGASITPLLGQLRWLLLVWLLFSVFMNAGMLVCASSEAGQEQSAARTFWVGGAEFFFPFLKISLFFLLLMVVWTVVVLAPIALNLESWLQNFPSEKYAVWLVLGLLAVYLLGLVKLYIWSVASRLARIRTGATVLASLRSGWRIFWKKKWALLGLVLGFVGFQLVLAKLYWLLEAYTGMVSPGLILLLFVVQQAFAFFKIQIRQMMYAGMARLASGAA